MEVDRHWYQSLGHMLCLEVDPLAYECAHENIQRNGCMSVIQLLSSPGKDCFFKPIHDAHMMNDERIFTFTMCNPPFYMSEADRNERISSKKKILGVTLPQRGSDSESFTEGGEYAFVSKMIEDSCKYATRIL